MTAPQNQAKTKTNAIEASMSAQQQSIPSPGSASRGQKIQRFWFMAFGLSGGFGFVASQMGLAIAQTDLLVNDYLPISEAAGDQATELSGVDYATAAYSSSGYTTTGQTAAVPTQPTFTVPAASQPTPVPETFIEAPTNAAAFVAEPIAAQPTAAQPAAAQLVPVVPAVADTVQTTSVLDTPAPNLSQGSARSERLTSSPVAAAAPEGSVARTTAGNTVGAGTASIEIEITPAGAVPARETSVATTSEIGIRPTVTPPRPPAFTASEKPVAQKMIHRGHPLVGLIEANMVAAPLSAYAVDRGENRLTGGATLVAANELDLGTEAGPAEAGPAAVPDILPEPVEAAPPVVPSIVEVAPVAEEVAPVQPTEIVPAALPEGTNLPEEYNSIFVDPTDYSVGATEAPDVVVAEDSTGCEFTVGQGQAVPNGACGTEQPAAPAPVANQPTGDPSVASENAPANVASQQPAPAAPVASAPSVNVGPVSFSATGIRLSTSAAGRDYLNRSVRPLVNLQAAESFIFPLSIPSPITSLFGFRIHPITGDWRFHAGTDIGAAQGTPVLAAQDGTVATASNAGGYGLMVVLRHEAEEVQLESRYAHLSEIFVEAGKEVKKGDIIGLVGNTGNSTGPHLHFEMRQMTADGWVPVNADGLVQASLANLVKALNSPMQAVSFNLSDFNLSNLRTGSLGAKSGKTLEGTTLIPGQDGIPFRPAQPNAS
ncbi:MAG: peptidoglycan DD-metalloendopeptidase family protein [Cyanobacteria bacterium J06626_6]